jgi:hypothetical protein
MGLLIVLAVLALFVWIDVATIRALFIRRHGVVWWVTLGALLSAGAVGGVWASAREYQPTDRLRVTGFPFAAGIWKLEGDDWVDYVSPAGPLVPLLNTATFLILAPLPVAVAYAAWRLKAKLLPSNH